MFFAWRGLFSPCFPEQFAFLQEIKRFKTKQALYVLLLKWGGGLKDTLEF
jgi:hypothetical protein